MHSVGNVWHCVFPIICLSLCLSSCAEPPVMIDGKPVARLNLEFTGQPFLVRHSDAHPRPGGPSSGTTAQGGRIFGTICGTDIDYLVEHAGSHVSLSGILGSPEVTTQMSSRIKIAETFGYFSISGSLANREVRFDVYADRIRGYVAQCAFDMEAQGDSLIASFYDGPAAPGNLMTLRLNGLRAFRQMPPADQAAVLPTLLSCLIELAYQNRGRANPPAVGFGGKSTAVPMNTLSFHHGGATGLRYCRGNQTLSQP